MTEADENTPTGDALKAWMRRIMAELGEVWGLGRSVTPAELGRALKLSPKYGGSHISKLEKAETGLSGPIEVAVQAMLDGWKPPHFEGVVKPGYPRPRK